MPQLNAYLVFDGECAAAMRFYESVFGGTLSMTTQADALGDGEASADEDARILHARLVFAEGQRLMGSDCPPGMPYEGIKGFSLSLIYPGIDEAQRVFDALAVGGQVTMPMQRTYWAGAFGMLTDRFGTLWMVNGELIDP
ncbi:VOC family protein [Chitiniphilus shinanonensis]|uniref:VOC family protein n=1 Tax=Chitiniphilus shinanonensis TaxID=553088 RepID=A0ABQ6BZJ6_9NEIS|nr:VOC family protein [Chitiniphilus shinanonensis]GLS05139.1 VOC family protein [Chitiniphilus shinanonensis]